MGYKNNEHFLTSGELLNRKQELNEAGYSFSLSKNFNKEVIKKHKIKFKEWDYYYFGNTRFGFGVVIGDLRYAGQFGIVLFDFEKKYLIDKSAIILLPLGRMKLPTDSSTSFEYHNKKNVIKLDVNPETGNRKLFVKYKNFYDGKDLLIDVDIKRTCDDTMVISTPFFKNKHFYYNQKINNLCANGRVLFGEEDLNTNNDFMGVLDWGRGVWTYNNTWNWCSINQKSGDDYVGFNLGNGFGDTSKSGENMFFLNKTAYKLNQIDIFFSYLKKDRLDVQGKTIFKTQNSDELYLEFTPIFNRNVSMNLLLIKQVTNQMFGYFSGYVHYGDGQVYKVENLFGFIEKVSNKW